MPPSTVLDWYLGYLHCELFQHGDVPLWSDVLVTEGLVETAGPLKKPAQTFTVEEYRPRFAELCGRGWHWINLHAVGLWNGRLLVDITVPSYEPSGRVPTSVNVSGPTTWVRARNYELSDLFGPVDVG